MEGLAPTVLSVTLAPDKADQRALSTFCPTPAKEETGNSSRILETSDSPSCFGEKKKCGVEGRKFQY